MIRFRILPARPGATAAAVAAATALGGCGGGDKPPRTTAARDARAPIALAARRAAPGEVLARGAASPAEHGPYALSGRYLARFEQSAPEDPSLDFGGETAFVAVLQQGRTRIRLFRRAAARGRATVSVPRGRWTLVVDFGDYPYVIRLTPVKR